MSPGAGPSGCWLLYALGTWVAEAHRHQPLGPCNLQEAANYVAALKLVEKTGNARGLGICHNNLANLVGQNKEVQEGLQLSPEHHFEQAGCPNLLCLLEAAAPRTRCGSPRTRGHNPAW